METPRRNLDRLLPRHPVQPRRVEIEWDVRQPRRIVKKRAERSFVAEIVDLSLDGALVEVSVDAEHSIDDIVVLRLGGATGRAQIKHRRMGDPGPSWLYGVQWIKSPELKAAVDVAVEQLREDPGRVRQSWEQQRR